MFKYAAEIFDVKGALEDENIAEKAYECLLGVMEIIPKKTICGVGSHLREKHPSFYDPLASGIYVPGSDRACWSGRFDIEIDELPKRGSVYHDCKNPCILFCFDTVEKINSIPRGVFNICRNPFAYYKFTRTYVINASSEHTKGADKRKLIQYESVYLVIDNLGQIWCTIDPLIKKTFASSSFQEQYAHHLASNALSILADKKYLWVISSSEPAYKALNAKVDFGVCEDHVKSLCYARSLPLTSSWRKRPILHWVESHKRRLEKGIDIDVKKHLRGIDRFEMGDLVFNITQPKKKAACS